ncbi:hypothetical protein TRIUR3_15157 [Triticum urartu]|uniref:Uncharacterized protein n=1 Tax=Triticum urartu TaxID=4572 RepID=M7ZSN1_TRIUA|nr:hypothetical protein TRIUR3_15157 [Triticum urartu]
MEVGIIVMMTLGALLLMDQLPDHAAAQFTISQFLLFLSCTVAALTRMVMKLPAGASPGIALATEMLHKTLLLLLLATAHIAAAEWLGEDVVLLCLPEVIPVLLWFSLHLDRKPGSSSIISVDKLKPHRNWLIFLGAMVVAPPFAYLANSMDEVGLSGWSTTFQVSGIRFPHSGGCVPAAQRVVTRRGMARRAAEEERAWISLLFSCSYKVRDCECESDALKTLILTFYMSSPHLSTIGRTVEDLVRYGDTECLEFCISAPPASNAAPLLATLLAELGKQFMSFSRAYPTTFQWLTRLTLKNLAFGHSDITELINACDKLKHLTLSS